MNRSLVLTFAILALAGCSNSSSKLDQNATTTADTATAAATTTEAEEQEAVKKVIEEWHHAYEAKDWSRIEPLLSTAGDLRFFGTDSAEVVKSVEDFRKLLSYDWQVVESAHFGEMRNVSFAIDDHHTLATIFFETRLSGKFGGQALDAPLRFANTLRKVNGSWRLVQGLAGMATVGQSTADAVAQMKKES